MMHALFLSALMSSGLTSQGAAAAEPWGSEPCPVPAIAPDEPPSPEASWLVLDGCVGDP
jgi:hypothetical protein